MAFYALYKWFRTFRVRPFTNWIHEYKWHLYTQWYESLSDEEKIKEDERVRLIKERREKERKSAVQKLCLMNSMVMSMLGDKAEDYYSAAKLSNQLINCRPSKYW